MIVNQKMKTDENPAPYAQDKYDHMPYETYEPLQFWPKLRKPVLTISDTFLMSINN